MEDDFEAAIYYNPPNIAQSMGGPNAELESLRAFPTTENVNLRDFFGDAGGNGDGFLVPGMPGFEELRALIQLMGYKEHNYYAMDITWGELRSVLETAGYDMSQVVTMGE